MNGPPSQPLEVEQSKHIYSHQSQHLNRRKSYARSIQTSWYKKYPWITVCITTYKIFFHSCRLAKRNNLITFSKCQVWKKDFVTGKKHWRNWKNMIEVRCIRKQYLNNQTTIPPVLLPKSIKFNEIIYFIRAPPFENIFLRHCLLPSKKHFQMLNVYHLHHLPNQHQNIHKTFLL